MSEELEWELYEIFESGLFAFPIWDHSSARAVVRYLIARGVLGEEIADAIEDSEMDLAIWLNRAGKHMVGEWVISWINETRDEYLHERELEEFAPHAMSGEDRSPSITNTSETGSLGSQTDLKTLFTSDLESNAGSPPPPLSLSPDSTEPLKELDTEEELSDNEGETEERRRQELHPPELPPRTSMSPELKPSSDTAEDDINGNTEGAISSEQTDDVNDNQMESIYDVPQRIYDVPPVPDGHYDVPPSPDGHYDVPSTPDGHYDVPSTPDRQSDVPSTTSTSEGQYDVPSTPEGHYDVPRSLTSVSSMSTSVDSLYSSIPVDLCDFTSGITTCLTETITRTSAFMQSELMLSGQGSLPMCPNCTCKLTHYSYTKPTDKSTTMDQDTTSPDNQSNTLPPDMALLDGKETKLMESPDLQHIDEGCMSAGTPSPKRALSVDDEQSTDSESCKMYISESVVKAMQLNLVTLDKDGPGYIFVLTDCIDKCLPWAGDCCYKVASSRLPERHLMEFKLRSIPIELVWQVRVEHHQKALREVQSFLTDYILDANWFRCPLATIVDAVAKVAKRYREEE